MKERPLNIFGSKELPVNISLFVYFRYKNILFLLLKTNSNVAGLDIFHHCYFYPAYVDGTTL